MHSGKEPGPLKIAANRRNALKSTGPRTAAGKRRPAVNTRSRDLIPEELSANCWRAAKTLAISAACTAT